MYYIGIDLGGTNIVAGVVDKDYNIIAKARVKTNLPRETEKIVDDMAFVAGYHPGQHQETGRHAGRWFRRCA